MRKHLQLINNFQLDQKIRISPVIDQTILHSSPALLGVQCQSIWEACVNNPWVFVQKATKLLYTCDKGGTLFCVTCEATFFSRSQPICGHSGASFYPRIVCSFMRIWKKTLLKKELYTFQAIFFFQPICGHSQASFCCCIVFQRASEICRPDFIWRAWAGGFSGFYSNPHSASVSLAVKAFVMKQTKARSWSGMPVSGSACSILYIQEGTLFWCR